MDDSDHIATIPIIPEKKANYIDAVQVPGEVEGREFLSKLVSSFPFMKPIRNTTGGQKARNPELQLLMACKGSLVYREHGHQR